jgi:hypothetical protein
MNWVIIILSVGLVACSAPSSGRDVQTTGTKPDVASTAIVECPTCPSCPVPEPCPACEKIDAVFYTMIHRVDRGRPESFASTAFVHRAGKWYQMAYLFPEKTEGPSAEPEEDFAAADAQLAHVRAHPADVGIKSIEENEYFQYGRMLKGWQVFDRIDDAPGIRVSFATVFVLLE